MFAERFRLQATEQLERLDEVCESHEAVGTLEVRLEVLDGALQNGQRRRVAVVAQDQGTRHLVFIEERAEVRENACVSNAKLCQDAADGVMHVFGHTSVENRQGGLEDWRPELRQSHHQSVMDDVVPVRLTQQPEHWLDGFGRLQVGEQAVASMEEVRITREGDAAVIEYADESVATTNFGLGAAKLATMTDEDVLEAWNDCLRNMEAHRRSIEYVATEIPIGKPQVKFFARGDQWVPRGGVLRCQILSDGGIEPSLDEPFVAIDDRDFTLAEFMKMMGTHGGGGMRIAFVPNDELHVRPKLKVREPPRGKKK